MSLSVILIAAVIGVCRASVGHEDAQYVNTHPRYDFSYGVDDPLTGDSKSHSETRDRDVVHGRYSVRLPDGSFQTVKYTASDATGYNAVVEKSDGAGIVNQAEVLARSTILPAPAPAPVAVPVYQSPQILRSDARGFSYAVSAPVNNYARVYQPQLSSYYYKPPVSYYQQPRYTAPAYSSYLRPYYDRPYYSAYQYQQPLLSSGYLPPVPRSGSNYVTFSSPDVYYSH